jgi:serine/threonine-protein phosphatase 2B catalytic subunit
MHKWNGPSEFPVVITIFSAPNYCDVYNNKGAIIKFESNTLNILQFNYTPHPYILPNFMDIFTWSVPFVAEKIVEMLYNVLKQGQKDDIDTEVDELSMQDATKKLEDDAAKIKQEKTKKVEAMRSKVLVMSKMMKMFKTLREENENIMKIKDQTNQKLRMGLLQEGKEGIEAELDNRTDIFDRARGMDMKNEMMPDSPSDASTREEESKRA